MIRQTEDEQEWWEHEQYRPSGKHQSATIRITIGAAVMVVVCVLALGVVALLRGIW